MEVCECERRVKQMKRVLVTSVSVIRGNDVLLIQETTSEVRNKWNFPSGRVELKESILSAACREVKEETGLEVNLIAATGVYNFISRPGAQVILHHFIAKEAGGTLCLKEEGIVNSKWMNLKDLQHISPEEFREPTVMMQIIQRLDEQESYPLTIYSEPFLKQI